MAAGDYNYCVNCIYERNADNDPICINCVDMEVFDSMFEGEDTVHSDNFVAYPIPLEELM